MLMGACRLEGSLFRPIRHVLMPMIALCATGNEVIGAIPNDESQPLENRVTGIRMES